MLVENPRTLAMGPQFKAMFAHIQAPHCMICGDVEEQCQLVRTKGGIYVLTAKESKLVIKRIHLSGSWQTTSSQISSKRCRDVVGRYIPVSI